MTHSPSLSLSRPAPPRVVFACPAGCGSVVGPVGLGAFGLRVACLRCGPVFAGSVPSASLPSLCLRGGVRFVRARGGASC